MKYIKSFKHSLNENYSEWGLPIKKYRIAGSDADYNESDIVDINDNTYSKLKETFEKNNINYSIKDILTYDSELFALDREIINGEISKKENKYSCYIDVIIKEVKNEYGSIIYKSSFKIWEYNDGNYNVTINNNNYGRSYVCFGLEGLTEFINDNFDFTLD